MEACSRVLTNSTPKLAKMLSWKYANLAASKVCEDMSDNHGVSISEKFLKSVSQRVGAVLLAKEPNWTYDDEVDKSEVAHISISRDGTAAPIRNEGNKETMVGTIGLYNESGERLQTLYTGCVPEHGKETFDQVFGQQIEQTLSRYPQANCTAVADGAADNWTFLEQYTTTKIIDFWHATEYLSEYSKVAYQNPEQREAWLEKNCHELKHQQGAAKKILEEMSEYAQDHSISDKLHPVVRAVTYFTNHEEKMHYAQNVEKGLPIGSGIVEAGCKTLVKQRFCQSGARWYRPTMEHLLMARSLILTKGRWNQFWNKIDRYGL